MAATPAPKICEESPLDAGRPSKRRRVSSAAPGRQKRAPPSAASPQNGRRQRRGTPAAETAAPSSLLFLLADGPYFEVFSWLDARSLGRCDAACRRLRELNASPQGPWALEGDRSFVGMELDAGGDFMGFRSSTRKLTGALAAPGRRKAKPLQPNWKGRCELFQREAPTFSQPFSGPSITTVYHPDEVAYCRCRLRTDLLANAAQGIYIEVEVTANADNLSLALVDFEGGGRSSVTFSPETGAVLRERKVQELPRAIEGTYIHLLPPAPSGKRFKGTMGLLLRGGHLAFFRRWDLSPGEDPALAGLAPDVVAGDAASAAPLPWETTGFCTDLSWAQGPRLSICLAFRDEGDYAVRIAKISRTPPVAPMWSKTAYNQSWSLLYGDADHPLAI